MRPSDRVRTDLMGVLRWTWSSGKSFITASIYCFEPSLIVIHNGRAAMVDSK